MEESKKKLVMILVIVVCLGVAGAVFFRGGSGSGGIEDIPDDEMTWVKCRNKSCNAEYEMGRKDYFKFQTANANPMGPAPGIPCEKCGEPSVYKAEKCQNEACGAVFFSGAVPNDFPDRCPKCMQSATEELRNKRKKEMSGG
ncbi:MAG: hypothetical protein RQ760_21845 [Sedimentisphaerales bacterium]|nr:hypothetical protein [Sedimentisphaerales bacterium]